MTLSTFTVLGNHHHYPFPELMSFLMVNNPCALKWAEPMIFRFPIFKPNLNLLRFGTKKIINITIIVIQSHPVNDRTGCRIQVLGFLIPWSLYSSFLNYSYCCATCNRCFKFSSERSNSKVWPIALAPKPLFK